MLFNSAQSSFVLNKMMLSDDNSGLTKLAKNLAFIVTTADNIFLDKEENFITKEDYLGKCSKKKPQMINWELTAETKKTDKYLCYKASYSFRYADRKTGEDRFRDVIAWCWK